MIRNFLQIKTVQGVNITIPIDPINNPDANDIQNGMSAKSVPPTEKIVGNKANVVVTVVIMIAIIRSSTASSIRPVVFKTPGVSNFSRIRFIKMIVSFITTPFIATTPIIEKNENGN